MAAWTRPSSTSGPGWAMSAKTQADLSGLFADLPETGAPAGPELPPRRHHRSVLSLVLIVVIIVVAAHAMLFAGPWLWLAVLAVACPVRDPRAPGIPARTRIVSRPPLSF